MQLRPATFSLKLFRAEDLPRSKFFKRHFQNLLFRKFHHGYAHFPVDSDILQGVKKLLMGEDKKELVDPYAIFQFAGKEVKSSIKYNSDHPEWNEEMHIGLQVKSIALSLFILSNQPSAFLFSFRRCVNASSWYCWIGEFH